MISGVISQGTALPRGALSSSGAYLDLEIIASPKVLGADSQVASSAGLYVDADGFFATRSARALVPAFKFDDGTIFAPRIRGTQVLQPVLYVAIDVLSLPAVALPGILQTHLHAVDDAMFAPFILSHGSLRPGLLNALDAVYAPAVVAAQTLLPNRHTDSDVFYSPTRRGTLAPSVFTESETFFAPSLAQSLATLDGTPTNATLSGGNLTATHSNTTTHSGARSSSAKSADKFYFEIVVGATHGAADAVGILKPTGDFTDFEGAFNSTIMYMSSLGSAIWTNGSNSGKSLGSATVAGDVVGVAVDLSGLLIWFRKKSGSTVGNWNGSGTNNPATGVGGVAVVTGSYAPAVGFSGSGTASGDNYTANFGQSAYVMTPPSSFNNWPA